jgi:hypothetical protein
LPNTLGAGFTVTLVVLLLLVPGMLATSWRWIGALSAAGALYVMLAPLFAESEPQDAALPHEELIDHETSSPWLTVAATGIDWPASITMLLRDRPVIPVPM